MIFGLVHLRVLIFIYIGLSNSRLREQKFLSLLLCVLNVITFFSVDMALKSNFKLKNTQYNYSEVVRITNNFKTIIGEGGFGKVYLGILKDETQVAVKLLSQSSKQGYKEFRAEVRS